MPSLRLGVGLARCSAAVWCLSVLLLLAWLPRVASARKPRNKGTVERQDNTEATGSGTGSRSAGPSESPADPSPSNAAPSSQPAAVVRIISPNDGALVSTESVTVQIAAKVSTGATIKRVVAVLDEQIVAQESLERNGERGIMIAAPPTLPGEVLYRLSVSIPQGTTRLSFRAETDRGDSPAVSLQVRRENRSSDGFVVKPRLYVLSVGISAYDKKAMSLVYPSKDASDLAEVLQKQEGKLYREVNTRLLVNEKATKAAILDGLDWLQRQTTAHDVAMVFFAGHGINDPSTGRYYFLPHDADPDAIKRTMLAQEEVQSTLRSIAGKVLLFLDTCHSGNVMGQWNLRGDADLDTFIREINTADSGVVVFAASTGRQSSKESSQWQNGAFTRALVEGLLGAAAYIKGRPVTVNMLDLFLSERVKALTQGTQSPTTAKPSNLQDFPIAFSDQDSPLAVSGAALQVMPSLIKPPTPVYKRWWLWTLVGIGVAGAVSAGVVAGTWQAVPNNLERIPLTR